MTTHPMQFADQLLQKQDKQPRKNTTILVPETLERISSELELATTPLITPAFSKDISLPPTLIQQFELAENQGDKYTLHAWTLISDQACFFLIGVAGSIQTSSQENNPFERQDNFYSAASTLKNEIGMAFAMPYISENGYYSILLQNQETEYLFFLYTI